MQASILSLNTHNRKVLFHQQKVRAKFIEHKKR